MKQRCLLVSFEGIDAAGKTTQAKLLEATLVGLGRSVVCHSSLAADSGGRVVAQMASLLRRMLNSGSALKWPLLFQIIMFLNRLIFQRFVLRKQMATNDVVILDRWSISFLAYGCATLGVRINDGSVMSSLLIWMSKFLVQPDVVFFLKRFPAFPKEGDSYEKDPWLQWQTLSCMYEIMEDCPWLFMFIHDIAVKDDKRRNGIELTGKTIHRFVDEYFAALSM